MKINDINATIKIKIKYISKIKLGYNKYRYTGTLYINNERKNDFEIDAKSKEKMVEKVIHNITKYYTGY